MRAGGSHARRVWACVCSCAALRTLRSALPSARRPCSTAASAPPPSLPRVVVVGLSGGVDSAVSALLLREQGYRVRGAFMVNWDEREERGKNCSTDRDRADSQRVAQALGIDWHEVNYVQRYWSDVFEETVRAYAAGDTPNPDLLCNRHIKFDAFTRYAREQLGADLVATGHYARVERTPAGVRLLAGIDETKDQSYFLAAVAGAQLERVVFPVGHMRKADVRALAARAGLGFTTERKESAGLCFVGKRRWPDFIQQYVAQEPATARAFPDGRVLGRADPLCCYTIGQGARLGGQPHRWYVQHKDVGRNELWLCSEREHAALYASEFSASPTFWVSAQNRPAALRDGGGVWHGQYRIRHLQPLQACTVRYDRATDRLHVSLDERGAQRALAARQALVLYDGAVCLGGGWIERPAQSLWDAAGSTVGVRLVE